MSYNYHLIVNVQTLAQSPVARAYPNMLCLSQLYEASPVYRHVLKQKVARGDRIILDNGAHEGFDVDIDSYIDVVRDLKPTVVVLTDLVGRPGKISRDRSMLLADKICGIAALKGTQFMFTPQGLDIEDVLGEYHWAIDNLDPEHFVIGLGQGYLCWAEKEGDENREATRRPMVESVMSIRGSELHRFHVLGARWSADDSNYDQYENIIGIDTIKPCTCASYGLTYPSRPPVRSMDRLNGPAVDDVLLSANITAFCREYGCKG